MLAWMRCVIGKFQSVSGTPLKWQPYLSTSRACLQRSPPFAFRVTGKRWQGCVYGNVCMCECRCMTAILAVNPVIKSSTNTQTAAFKAERGHAALFFFDFSDFCSAQIVFFQENWVKSLPTWELNLLESSWRCLYIHTHTHVPILHSFPGWNGSPLGIHFSAYYTSEVLQAPARNRSAFLCFTPELSFHLSVCQLQSHTKGKSAVG